MTKAEIIAEIKSNHFVTANEPLPVATAEADTVRSDGVNWYSMRVYRSVGNEMSRGNITFFVVNEGGATEAAYYDVQKPREYSDVVRKAVESKIQEGVTAGTFKKALVSSVDEENMYAVIDAFVDNAGTIERRNFIIMREGNKVNIYPFVQSQA